jgi:hypothetical protein
LCWTEHPLTSAGLARRADFLRTLLHRAPRHDDQQLHTAHTHASTYNACQLMARMGVQETGITALVETLLNDHIRADWKNLVNEYISERKDSLPDSSKYLHQAGLGQPLLPVLISDWHCPANSISRKCVHALTVCEPWSRTCTRSHCCQPLSCTAVAMHAIACLLANARRDDRTLAHSHRHTSTGTPIGASCATRQTQLPFSSTTSPSRLSWRRFPGRLGLVTHPQTFPGHQRGCAWRSVNHSSD